MQIRDKLILMLTVFIPVIAFAQESEIKSVSQQVEGFNLNGYDDNGEKSWEINGNKADIVDDNISLTGVDANVYNEKQNANLKARTGKINKATGEVQLNEDVVITSEQGTTMKTDSLYWNRNKDLVTSPDEVFFNDQQGTLKGKGLSAQPNLKKAQLNEDVEAVIRPESKTGLQTITITSDGSMQLDQIKMYAIFRDNVKAEEKATGRELLSDTMEIWFDQKNKRIKKMVCTGNVQLVQGGNISYANEMIYNGIDGTITMSGRPKLVFETSAENTSGLFDNIGDPNASP